MSSKNTASPSTKDATRIAKRSCNIRGTTPRNVSLQVKCQKASNIEKTLQKNERWVARSSMDVDAIVYPDDIVETYADEVTRRLDDMIKRGHGSSKATRRLVDVNCVKESLDKLACGQCAKDAVCEAEEGTMDRFKLFVEEDGKNNDTKRLIDEFRKSNAKNKTRRMQTAEDKSKVHLMEDIMGISSDMQIQCNSVPCHRYPMTFKNMGK